MRSSLKGVLLLTALLAFAGPAGASGLRELPLRADYCSILYALANATDARCQGAVPVQGRGQARGIGADPLVALPTDPGAGREAMPPRHRPDVKPAPSVRVAATEAVAPAPADAGTADDAEGGYFIRFGLNSDRIEGEYIDHVDALAEVMRSELLADTCLRLVGHTDASGPADYNLALGLRRARAVRAALTDRGGLAPDRVEAISRGEAELLPGRAPNDAVHRRVEVLSRARGAGGCG